MSVSRGAVRSEYPPWGKRSQGMVSNAVFATRGEACDWADEERRRGARTRLKKIQPKKARTA